MLRAPVSEMTYAVSSGTLNSTIPYHTTNIGCDTASQPCRRSIYRAYYVAWVKMQFNVIVDWQ